MSWKAYSEMCLRRKPVSQQEVVAMLEEAKRSASRMIAHVEALLERQAEKVSGEEN
jgi:hypothetical protein